VVLGIGGIQIQIPSPPLPPPEEVTSIHPSTGVGARTLIFRFFRKRKSKKIGGGKGRS
jgi:hypothetical protein